MILRFFFATHWIRYVVGILLLVVTDLLALLIPRAVGKAVDQIGQDNAQVTEMIVLIGAVALAMAVLRFGYRELIMGTTRRMEHYLRSRIFGHALQLPLSVYDEQGPGKIMALAVNDVTAVRVAIGFGIMLSIDAVVMGLASFIVMFRMIDPALTFWSVLPLPAVLLATAWLGRLVHVRFRRVQEQFSHLTEFVQELYGGIRIVKAFGAEKKFFHRFDNVNQQTMEANLALSRIQAIYIPATHVAPLFCYAIALYWGGSQIIAGTISVGDLTAFIGYLGLIIWPVMGIGYLINTVQRGLASFRRIQDFLAKPAYEEVFTSTHSRWPDLASDIVVDHLSFQYENATSPSLEDISFRVKAGETLGIVGRTGSGKTTLLRLLMRLYPVEDGRIWIGGQDINQIGFVQLRQMMGYVPQDTSLFSMTIAENIVFGEQYDREQIVEAARQALIVEDIDARTEGFATLLGEKGLRVSGGQRQRIAIARALIRKPTIFLLDDVFSALDFRTQNALLESLATVAENRTTLIVSQRINAVKNADSILVLEKGRICEQGTHEQLIQRKGLYYKLYEQQLMSGDEP